MADVTPISTRQLIRGVVVVAGVVAIAHADPIRAQEAGTDSVTVAAGDHYAAGGLHRFFFGGFYRDLWTASLPVEVLDLGTVGGGLTPVSVGGGFQTKSIWFRGADGFMYGFRSVDKDPSVLPPELEGTILEDIVKDQTSAQHPAAPAVVAPLLDAVGTPHTEPRLVILPDDARLGEHRERFAGTLGFFERRATIEPDAGAFDDAVEILDADEFEARVREDPRNVLDLERFLAARLFDYWIGDWDRHRGQWTFLRHPADTGTVIEWTPVPEDRDQAFVRFDGVLLWLARQYVPQLLNFGDRMPPAWAFVWNGRDLDRHFLVKLEWSVWDSVATDLQERLTDSIIDQAVLRLPPEYVLIDGARMARALKARRQQLHDKARDYYRLLAKQVDVRGSDAAETFAIERVEDGSSLLAVLRGSGTSGDTLWHRRFGAGETKELRLHVGGGGDRVEVRGARRGMKLRIVADDGDTVVNETDGGGVEVYTTGDPAVRGNVSVDHRPFVLPPKKRPEELPPRDWGHMWRSVVWGGYGPDAGLFLGGGKYVTHYGFRTLPYASRVLLRAGFATGALTGRVDVSAEAYRRNSRMRGLLDIRLSGVEILRYNGLGNDVPLDRDDDYYRVRQQLVRVDPAVAIGLGTRTTITVGPTLVYARTREQAGRILADIDAYGEDGFGQLGARGDIEIDTRDVGAAASRGIHLSVGGRVFPSIWSVESTFGEVHGAASTYLTAGGIPLKPTIALRAGGKKVWGTFPFQEAAYIGDQRSARLGRQNRYGGDAAVYGNAELRLELGQMLLVLPARIGIFGLGDIGRVYREGETSDTWHWAAGGGLWLAFLGKANTLTLALAQGDEKLGVYATAGFAF
jgi:hypothetical protein